MKLRHLTQLSTIKFSFVNYDYKNTLNKLYTACPLHLQPSILPILNPLSPLVSYPPTSSSPPPLKASIHHQVHQFHHHQYLIHQKVLLHRHRG